MKTNGGSSEGFARISSLAAGKASNRSCVVVKRMSDMRLVDRDHPAFQFEQGGAVYLGDQASDGDAFRIDHDVVRPDLEFDLGTRGDGDGLPRVDLDVATDIGR